MRTVRLPQRTLVWIIMLLLLVSLSLLLTGCESTETTQKKSFSLSAIDRDAYDIVLEEKSVFVGNTVVDAYTYNGKFPGEELEYTLGETTELTVFNALDVPSTIHFHGIIPQNPSDGVPGVTQEPIGPGESYTYELKFTHPGLFWYHSHVEGHEQVERGLQGPLVVRDPNDDFPKESEITLVLDDMLLDEQGEWYEFSPNFMHGRLGNQLIINGKSQESFSVDTDIVRLRLVNTANARNFYLYFGGKNVTVISKDLGYGQPQETSQLFLAPGNRADILINGSEIDPTTISYLTSRGSYPLAEIQHGNTLVNYDLPTDDALLGIKKQLLQKETDEIIRLGASGHMMGGFAWTFNGQSYPDNPLTYSKEEGWQVFEIKNTHGQVHPIHFHGLKFVVLERNGQVVDDPFWYDTVHVGGGERVKIGLLLEEQGSWVFHCHILEHAESGMLGVLEVK